jgi:hypothetical protein
MDKKKLDELCDQYLPIIDWLWKIAITILIGMK